MKNQLQISKVSDPLRDPLSVQRVKTGRNFKKHIKKGAWGKSREKKRGKRINRRNETKRVENNEMKLNSEAKLKTREFDRERLRV